MIKHSEEELGWMNDQRGLSIEARRAKQFRIFAGFVLRTRRGIFLDRDLRAYRSMGWNGS
jgi:hypothetical protein